MDYSIVVPIYNVGKYLRECIESVICQKNQNYELILVNDGSTDNSLAICNDYASDNPRIKVINKPNGGLVSARKAGISAATGDYIVSLDGDDYISNDFLKIIEEIREKYDNPDMIFLGGFDDYDGELKEYTSKITGYFDRTAIVKNIFPHCINGLPCGSQFRNGVVYKVMKKDLIFANLDDYIETVSMGEDLLLSTACLGDSHSIFICNHHIYFYRQFQSQMTKVYKKNLFYNEDILIRKLLEISKRKSMNIEKQLYRHALNTAKSTVFNEIRYRKGKSEINAAYQQIYATQLYKKMLTEMDTKGWSWEEKLFSKLLKRRANFVITALGKLQFQLRGAK